VSNNNIGLRSSIDINCCEPSPKKLMLR